jgi:hypothetical protein
LNCSTVPKCFRQSEHPVNPDLVAPLLADKFVNTDREGKVTGKAETLADAKATKYGSVDYDDSKLTVFGDTAIATGVFTAKGTDSSGKPLDTRERFSDTWVKMPNGKWQCVASDGSPVKIQANRAALDRNGRFLERPFFCPDIRYLKDSKPILPSEIWKSARTDGTGRRCN